MKTYYNSYFQKINFTTYGALKIALNAEIERNYDSGGSKTLRTLKLSYPRYENDIIILTFKK